MAENIINEYNSLPGDAQKQVQLFIAFLKNRYKSENKKRNTELKNSEFYGIWQNRDELKDSSAWVRKQRMKEWANKVD